MADALHYLELTELAALLKARAVSALDVTRAQLDRIGTHDPELDAYVHVTAETAIADAKTADAEIAHGRYRGPLHGVPIALKDLFWTKGIPTAAGTTLHRDFRPSEDATVVRRLKDAGAVVLGKLQLTEGAYSDHHPFVTPPKNPWNADYWPGISSSGPAVATAAGLCFGSLGSDSGGSIRWPCAANGLTGLKPSWGRISRHGMFELAASLDHAGPIGRSAADVAALLGVIAGHDPNDPTSLVDPLPDYLAEAKQDVRGLRIGVDAAWNSDDVDVATQRVLTNAVDTFRALGADIVDVQFPDVMQAIADWTPNCAVEAAVAHEATYPARKDEYGPILTSVIEAGRALSALDYQKILLRRLALRGQVTALFETIDLLLIPVHPFPPVTLAMIRTLGEQPDLIAKMQRYTCTFDMTGHPTITLPGGASADGLPIAFQLVAAHLDEAMLVRAGAAFQRVTSWHCRHPALTWRR
ncbi:MULTISPECIES: amidase [unclassified Bradyrhizobium]|uniref:amidase n=1 Tax=unclassified Bradyrhizobium TaxID=2631580 RepID=UPI001FF8C9BE|nr:amidase [Bradyrhizobium sp. 143]MCK1725926.1 amidase [Bradyrhizobium sp. 142]